LQPKKIKQKDTPAQQDFPASKETTGPRLTVVGIGGAGENAVNNMIRSGLEGVKFLACNTDEQALQQSLADMRIQLGPKITQGLGAGSRPDIGRAAAEESLDEIMGLLRGTNMVFITAGMGGGTGTGAAPLIAKALREAGILTIGVVTKPFHFEGGHRMRTAEQGIEEMNECVDTLLVIPNQNLFRLSTENTTFSDAFAMADDVLYSGVRTFTDLMTKHGLINLDYADICAVMRDIRGKAMMGTGQATGERRAIDAAEQAISCPLLDDDVVMRGARAVLINVTGGLDMTLFEVDEAANRIRDEVDPAANIIFGATFDESLEGELRVSVVATGIDAKDMLTLQPEAGFDMSSRSVFDNPDEVPEKEDWPEKLTSAPQVPNHEPPLDEKLERNDFDLPFGRGHEKKEEFLFGDEKLDLGSPVEKRSPTWSAPESVSPPPTPQKTPTRKKTFSLLERLGMRRAEAKRDKEPPEASSSPQEAEKDSTELLPNSDFDPDKMPTFMRQNKKDSR
jgi:cell division protein FtsZ